MRRIDLIVIHCTGTRENHALSSEALDAYHRSLGYDECGYHFYIRSDGRLYSMRALDRVGAHALGYNSHSIGIAYEGGLDSLGNAKDTRTLMQRISLQTLVATLLRSFPGAEVVGHRDLSPDQDGNGVVDSHEWVKSCPCFDVRTAL